MIISRRPSKLILKSEEQDGILSWSEVKTVEAKDSPDSPPAAEDRAEVVSTADDKSSPVIAAEDNMPVRKAVLARKYK